MDFAASTIMLACSNTVGSVRLEQSITWFQVVGKALPKAGEGEQGEEAEEAERGEEREGVIREIGAKERERERERETKTQRKRERQRDKEKD